MKSYGSSTGGGAGATSASSGSSFMLTRDLLRPPLLSLLTDREPLAEGARPEAERRLEPDPSRFLSKNIER